MADTNRLTRRAFLVGAAASGALVAAGCSSDGGGGESSGATTTTATTLPVPDLPGDPFTLGVASGDPLSDRVVLWTRLAPEPLHARGGMPRGLDVPVRWEVQTLAGREPVADGVTVAPADHGHTVHLDVDGLDPDTAYRYRFSVGEYRTRWARTRTLPAAGTTPDEFVLAQVSCSQYDGARFAAYRDVAEHEPDLVVHLGDYIYEHPGGGLRPGVVTAIELDDYRTQYALYRTDPNLRAAHAVAPWIITWDDHEVSNNYVGSTPDPDSESPDEAALLERRAAAYRAWWENQPVRLDPPDGPDLEIHRRFAIGDLAALHVLDTRQYRTALDCERASGISAGRRCATSTADATTVLGDEQEAWLAEGLAEPAAWHVLAQQIVVHQWRFGPGDDAVWNLDQWDGYPTARSRLFDSLKEADGAPVVLTGDVHTSWAAELLEDFDDPDSDRVGVELVAPGVASSGAALAAVEAVLRANNPHIVYDEVGHRGWVRNTITADEWTAEFRLVEDHTDADSPVTTDATVVARPDGSLTLA
ncbi:MAG: alkaline phosphatase D family protein [Acidimicrobiales bacterium]|nr:alkaline phosphatase D family protein [Acidimicrobiales bacterium]MCB9371210.1 alkaline phosphatase D family protein [Microthrixaceae bacterium]